MHGWKMRDLLLHALGLVVLLAAPLLPLGNSALAAPTEEEDQPGHVDQGPGLPDDELSRGQRSGIGPIFAPGLLAITHGVAAGDVTAHSVVIWARAGGEGYLNVQYSQDPLFDSPLLEASAIPAGAAEDYTGTIVLTGLAPATPYRYVVWFTEKPGGDEPPGADQYEGAFRTAPDSTAGAPVSFVWGAGLGGDGYCRGEERGYEILKHVTQLAPDFFLALGDMIYADGVCPSKMTAGSTPRENKAGTFISVADPTVPWDALARTRDIFWRHWRYNRDDGSLQNLLARTALYSVWDAHEVIDGFGGDWTYWTRETQNRRGYPELVLEGRDAFIEYTPIDPHPLEANRIYRSFRWGKDLEIFLLDTRSYRARNDMADTEGNAKTMLGQEQLDWLRHGLKASTAVWKVVASSVPLSIPLGGGPNGCDGWANGAGNDPTGFERELLGLLRDLDRARISNLAFVSAGANWPAQIRYEQDLDGDRHPLVFHELVAGPLSAKPEMPSALDPTLAPQALYREGGFANFGHVSIAARLDGKVHLTAEVRGEDGKARPGSTLDITAE